MNTLPEPITLYRRRIGRVYFVCAVYSSSLIDSYIRNVENGKIEWYYAIVYASPDTMQYGYVYGTDDYYSDTCGIDDIYISYKPFTVMRKTIEADSVCFSISCKCMSKEKAITILKTLKATVGDTFEIDVGEHRLKTIHSIIFRALERYVHPCTICSILKR